jgi:hypothetical protein
VAASVLPLAGCRDIAAVPTLDQRFSQLELGMEAERIVAVMGEGGRHTKGPSEAVGRIVTEGGMKPFPKATDYMTWGDNASYVFVGLSHGKLTFAVLVSEADPRRLGP